MNCLRGVPCGVPLAPTALLRAAEAMARECGKTLLTLETGTGKADSEAHRRLEQRQTQGKLILLPAA